MGYKKNIIIFLGILVVFFCSYNFVSALEVDYPDISKTGTSITSDTPLPEYLKYVFDVGIFAGFFAVFLSLVWAGVLFLMSPAKPDLRASARDRVSGAISGLLILVTLYLIITTINPALKFFKLDGLDNIPPPPDPDQEAGVYLYNQRNCSPPVPQSPNTTSLSDLGTLTNRINAVDIVHNSNRNLYYISILYESPDFWGKCQYINPNSHCIPVSPFASSASIYRYKPVQDNDDDGVFFYRKSFYNREGGWYKVSKSEIGVGDSGKFYAVKLDTLKFNDVPKEEQDCTKWDEKGFCINKVPPSLDKENISSIEIKGDYVVLLIYFDESSDTNEGPWSFCQAFPTKDDINKDGPKQIKWENIRKMGDGNLPNWMMIFTVQQK